MDTSAYQGYMPSKLFITFTSTFPNLIYFIQLISNTTHTQEEFEH